MVTSPLPRSHGEETTNTSSRAGATPRRSRWLPGSSSQNGRPSHLENPTRGAASGLSLRKGRFAITSTDTICGVTAAANARFAALRIEASLSSVNFVNKTRYSNEGTKPGGVCPCFHVLMGPPSSTHVLSPLLNLIAMLWEFVPITGPSRRGEAYWITLNLETSSGRPGRQLNMEPSVELEPSIREKLTAMTAVMFLESRQSSHSSPCGDRTTGTPASRI